MHTPKNYMWTLTSGSRSKGCLDREQEKCCPWTGNTNCHPHLNVSETRTIHLCCGPEHARA